MKCQQKIKTFFLLKRCCWLWRLKYGGHFLRPQCEFMSTVSRPTVYNNARTSTTNYVNTITSRNHRYWWFYWWSPEKSEAHRAGNQDTSPMYTRTSHGIHPKKYVHGPYFVVVCWGQLHTNFLGYFNDKLSHKSIWNTYRDYNNKNRASQWHHIERDGITNHRRLDCLLNRLFRRRSKKTSKLCVTGPCKGNPPVARKMFPFDDVILRFVNLIALSDYIMSCVQISGIQVIDK